MIEKVLGRMGVDVSWYLTPMEVSKGRWRDEAMGYMFTLTRGRKSETFIYRADSGPNMIPELKESLAKVLADERATRIFYQAEIAELLELIGESK